MMKRSENDSRGEARFAYEGLDRVIHERARLSLLTSLMTHRKGLSFIELKRLCSLTDGNLARHLQVLEEERMVRVTKEGLVGRAQTFVRVTAEGQKRYLSYLTVLERIVQDAAAMEKSAKQNAVSHGLITQNS